MDKATPKTSQGIAPLPWSAINATVYDGDGYVVVSVGATQQFRAAIANQVADAVNVFNQHDDLLALVKGAMPYLVEYEAKHDTHAKEWVARARAALGEGGDDAT